MATREELFTALRNADQAGDTESAARIAQMIKSQTTETTEASRGDIPIPESRGAPLYPQDVIGQRLLQRDDSSPSITPPGDVATPTVEPPSVQRAKETARTPEEESVASMAGDAALEFMAGVNQGVVDIIDFLGPDQINAALQLMGSDKRIPTLGEQPTVQSGTRGGFVDEGLGRDVARAAGQVIPAAVTGGAALRTAAQQLPRFTGATEGIVPGIIRQMGTVRPVTDVGYAAAAGIGATTGRPIGETVGDVAGTLADIPEERAQQVGGDIGEFVGSIFAPASVAVTSPVISRAIQGGGQGIRSFMNIFRNSTQQMTEEGSAKLMADALAREGISPDEAVRRIESLGPEAVPADIGNSFRRLLRTVSNVSPRLQGVSEDVLGARQRTQASRLATAFDESTGTTNLSLDDEIVRLNQLHGPKIKNLYTEAAKQPLRMSAKLQKLFNTDNSLSRASKKARRRLQDQEALGKQINTFDIIDQTKKQMDDEIGKALRQGEKNRAANLIELKNTMVKEVDTAVPQYKEARDLFAGKAALEDAAGQGELFFKLTPREVGKITEAMGDSEKAMFRLGAKDALFDKLDTIQSSADATKRLFGRTGDVRKLRALFDTEEQFDSFRKAMQTEADFILTRRAAQSNSTTAQQLSDMKTADASPNLVQSYIDIKTGGARMVVDRIVNSLRPGVSEEQKIRNLERAGDLLLTSGMNPTRLQNILRRGNENQIKEVLEKSFKEMPSLRRTPPVIAAMGERAFEEEEAPQAVNQ